MGHSAKSTFYLYALCSLRWTLSAIDYIYILKKSLGNSFILTLNEYNQIKKSSPCLKAAAFTKRAAHVGNSSHILFLIRLNFPMGKNLTV